MGLNGPDPSYRSLLPLVGGGSATVRARRVEPAAALNQVPSYRQAASKRSHLLSGGLHRGAASREAASPPHRGAHLTEEPASREAA